MTPRSQLRIFLAALAAVLLFATPAAHAADSGGVGFRVDGGEGSQMTAGFIKLAPPAGATVNAYFYATNTSSRAANITVFPADGLTGTTSGIIYGEISDSLRRTGAWITPDASSFTLEPRTERRVNITVRVPAGTQTGDYVGGVVLQQVNPSSSGQIAQIVRNVVPVHIEVPGEAPEAVEVRDASIATLPGSTLPAIDVDLRNTGRRMCRPTLSVTLKGPSENNVRVSRQLDVVLAGDRIKFPLPWPTPLASGSYLVKIGVSGCGSSQNGSFNSNTPGYDDNAGKKDDRNDGKNSPPRVVTDATPTLPSYTPGSRLTGSRAGGAGDATNANGSGSDGDSDGDGAGAAPPSRPAPPGVGTIGNGQELGDGGLLDKARHAALQAGPEIAKRASLLLALLALIGFLFFIQEALDRRDPKLALAPVHRDPDLSFDLDPFDSDLLDTRQVKPSPSVALEAT